MSVFRRVFRIALSLAIFMLVLKVVGTREVMQSFLGMSPVLFTAALALVLINTLLRTANWFQLLNLFKQTSFKQSLLTYLAGSFYGKLLPASVGSDAARAITISRRTSLDIRISVRSVVTLNLLGLAAVTALGAVGALFLSLQNQTTFLLIVLVLSGTVAMVLCVLIFTKVGRWLKEALSKVTDLWPASYRILKPLLSVALLLPTARRSQLVMAAVAFSNQVIRVSVAALVATSLGLTIDWWVFAAIAPLVAIVAMIPLSVFGVGLDQGAKIFLLSHFGVAGSDAVAISLTIASLHILISLVGGLAVIVDSAFGQRAIHGAR
jgi:hypothetical protein